MQTIHELRKAGNKVRVTHYRYPVGVNNELLPSFHLKDYGTLIAPKGGKTVIEVTTPEGLNFQSEATCSLKDAFNRKLGIIKCLGRLQKYLTNA